MLGHAVTRIEGVGDTMVTRPDEVPRLRLGEPQEALPPAAASAAPSAPAPSNQPTSIVAATSPTETAASTPASRRPLMIGVGIVVAVLAVLGGVFAFASGSGDGGGEPAQSTAISASERTAFRDQCLANGVNAGRCDCVLERAVDDLAPEEFRAGLAQLLEEDGVLNDALAELFDGCVADGS